MRIASSSKHSRYADPDWDYSVKVASHPLSGDEQEANDDDDDSSCAAMLEGQLNNSILVEEEEEKEHLPLRFSRQPPPEETNMCSSMMFTSPLCDGDASAPPPDSLFYQTYRGRVRPFERPDPISPSRLVVEPTQVMKTTTVANTGALHVPPSPPESSSPPPTRNNKTLAATTTTATATTPPKASNRRTTKRKNDGVKKKKTSSSHVVLHLSTIPSPRMSCPMASGFPTFPLTTNSHEKKNDDAASANDERSTLSPTSITEIFTDLQDLQSVLDQKGSINHKGGASSISVTSTSIASTTLGSMDTPAASMHQQEYQEYRTENASPYYQEEEEEYKEELDDDDEDASSSTRQKVVGKRNRLLRHPHLESNVLCKSMPLFSASGSITSTSIATTGITSTSITTTALEERMIPCGDCPMMASHPIFLSKCQDAESTTQHSTPSPTSVTDIYQDLQDLQSVLDSKMSRPQAYESNVLYKHMSSSSASASITSTLIATTALEKPPCVCPMESFPTFVSSQDEESMTSQDEKSTTEHSTLSPTSGTDIYQDSQDLQPVLDSKTLNVFYKHMSSSASVSNASTSIASTSLESMDRAAVLREYEDYKSRNDSSIPCYTKGIRQVDKVSRKQEKCNAIHKKRDERDKALERSHAARLLEEYGSTNGACKETSQEGTTTDTTHHKSTVVIENDGHKVASWRKHPPIVIQNDGRAIFSYDIVDEEEQHCFPKCPMPTVAEY